MKVTCNLTPRFSNYILDKNYQTYVVVGGYGSGKSYNTALKLILWLLEDVRTVLVVREVFRTHFETTYRLLTDIISENDFFTIKKNKMTTPIEFPNGSRIIFAGTDNPEKLKSLTGVTIVWLEEASEIKAQGFLELKGRLRQKGKSLHFILTTNPVSKQNWVYKFFFSDGEHTKLNDEILYDKNTVVVKTPKDATYYHHSTWRDNPHISDEYINNLAELQKYDKDLYRIAYFGKFGINGVRVLPAFEVANSHQEVEQFISGITIPNHYCGMDFGFEKSYNAVIRVAVDPINKYLYIYDEYYKNKMTDVNTAIELKELGYDKIPIIADSAEPKTIKYFNDEKFNMRGANKITRIEQVKKMRRFKKIICSPKCVNTIYELQELSFDVDKNNEPIYDEFTIDPHTLSAIWYALDRVSVADVKPFKPILY